MAHAFRSKSDLLSATLKQLRLHTLMAGATDAGGAWALSIPKHEGFKLYLVLKGEGWIRFEKSKNKYRLRMGDCFMVTSGEEFVAMSDLSVKRRTTLDEALRSAQKGILKLGAGGDCFTVSVHFNFEGPLAKTIFKSLPEAIHIPAEAEEVANLTRDIERFRAEFLSQAMGHDLLLNHLAPIILVQILRYYMNGQTTTENWLTSLADARLLKTFESVHANVKKRWSLEMLAKIAGMSRAGFALHFKKTVGLTPGEYLANCRMQTACGLLQSDEQSISSIADEVGYDSLSSFSNAFTRIVGCRPGAYRNSQVNRSS